jgi:hypothetical protein
MTRPPYHARPNAGRGSAVAVGATSTHMFDWLFGHRHLRGAQAGRRGSDGPRSAVSRLAAKPGLQQKALSFSAVMAHSSCSQAVGGLNMISTALILISASMSMQASDSTRAARETFTRCLRVFVDGSIRDHKTLVQFNADFPRACATEQTAFRQAIIQRDMATRSTRATAEESAGLEVEDARTNFNDLFQMSLPAEQVAHAAPAPAAAAPTQPTVAAQPAAQTTGAAQPAQQPH